MTARAEDILVKAKSRITFMHPFYSMVLLSTPLVEEKSGWCDTMATDGRQIFWGRKFVETLTVDECIGVLVHETLHIAFLHFARRGDRDPQLSNIAQDIVINQIIISGGMVLPKNGIFGDQYKKYDGWNWEKVYEDLFKNAKKIKISFDSPNGKSGDDGNEKMWGGVIEPQGKNGKKESKAKVEELAAEVKEKVAQAAEYAKKRGTLPGGLEGLIEAVGKPKIDWKDYIQNWVSGHIPDNYSWRRPNRKMFVNHGVYMPSMEHNGAGIGVLSIDTSGSVSDAELVKYITEIVGVIEICNPEKLIIIQHDASIQKVDEWTTGQDFSNLKVKGRGGTCIAPVFKHLDELDDQIDWMICFTDCGICDYPAPQDAPEFPVLWAATGPDNTPFGTYIPIRDAMDGV